ncbi:helix-turn-helix domain-containing protein [Sediminibacterium ginsengisoli]|uniref:Helix-turn-helix n=1 Tax=Sediminibacterium ginsengisoli TaxID=413434 RepID=A0A1T4RCZ3_9BACT|nr:helix-turn-helix transcriptional regulator [Sediminibacterium ginsengisoli]SKA13777.1 Helix-turn-helix [Sediminibacterium ginsengisoli]
MNRLTELRKAAGLTQEEVAEKSGLTVRTIQRLESGSSVPRAYTLRKLGEALGMAPEMLTVPSAPASVTPNTAAAENTDDSLEWLNLSCFSYLVLPFFHILIPLHLLKKHKTAAGKKIVRGQIYWMILLHSSMLLTLAYNLFRKHFFHHSDGQISYLLVAGVMYLLNGIRLVRDHVRIMSGKSRAHSPVL